MDITETLVALYESYYKVTIVIGEDVEVELSGFSGLKSCKSKGFTASPDDLARGLWDALDEAISGLPRGWRAK